MWPSLIPNWKAHSSQTNVTYTNAKKHLVKPYPGIIKAKKNLTSNIKMHNTISKCRNKNPQKSQQK